MLLRSLPLLLLLLLPTMPWCCSLLLLSHYCCFLYTKSNALLLLAACAWVCGKSGRVSGVWPAVEIIRPVAAAKGVRIDRGGLRRVSLHGTLARHAHAAGVGTYICPRV